MPGVLHTKEGIILTTIDIIDKLGIQGLSTREIAKRQGISEGAIFKHYKTKNDIILAVLDHFSQFDNDIIESINLKGMNPIEAITYFINEYVEYYENYPAITAITQSLDVLACDKCLSFKIKEIFNRRANLILQKVEEAKASCMLSSEMVSESLADTISGLLAFMCLKWRMNNYNFSLKVKTLEALRVIFNAYVMVK